MRYTAGEGSRDGFRTIQLTDHQEDVTAEIVPELGLNTISLCRNGQEFLWRPPRKLGDLRENRSLFGIPFLAPWANRLDKLSYWANGAQYYLNDSLGNLRFDHNRQPIHGLLLYERWTTEAVRAGDGEAELISLFPFSRHPKLLAQFPFAHSIRISHVLREGKLHIRTEIVSESDEPIPVSIGFHPYFSMPHSDRNEWKLRLPVKQHIQLNSTNIPTGEIRPISEALVDVKKAELDDVYTGLLREADCYAHFALWSPQARLTVGFGPKFPVSVVYAPHTGNFVCIEPMATITNGLNLARNGTHDSLQSVAPGATWSEEFWIKPELV